MANVFNRIEETELRKIINESNSIADVFRKMNLCISGDHYTIFKREVKTKNIDISHFYAQKRKCKDWAIEKIFVVDSIATGGVAKKYIIKQNLMPYKCEKCNNTGFWMGEPLTLQLDHINGINNDNRLENLRFLCPSCHSQTPTYSGKKGENAKKKYIQRCNFIGPCLPKKARKTKIKWPTPEELKVMIWNKPNYEISKILNVSDVAIKKKCKQYNIDSPPKGYWIRIHNGYSKEEALLSQKKITKPIKRFTLEEEAKIKELKIQGLSNIEISKILNVNKWKINRFLIKGNKKP
jgi:Zn finger protein HypA/HybF involved in hydrogenase expression